MKYEPFPKLAHYHRPSDVIYIHIKLQVYTLLSRNLTRFALSLCNIQPCTIAILYYNTSLNRFLHTALSPGTPSVTQPYITAHTLLLYSHISLHTFYCHTVISHCTLSCHTAIYHCTLSCHTAIYHCTLSCHTVISHYPLSCHTAIIYQRTHFPVTQPYIIAHTFTSQPIHHTKYVAVW